MKATLLYHRDGKRRHIGYLTVEKTNRMRRRTRRNYRRAAMLMFDPSNPQAKLFLRRARNG